MQSGKKIPKWMPRARVGIYVGKSLRHARSVSLVLNPRTGLVSPQYHCKYDDTFETVRGLREDTHGTWKEKCGFSKASTTTKQSTTTTTTTTRAKVPVELEDVQVPEVLNEVLDGTNEYQEEVLPPDIDVPEQAHEEHEGAPVLPPHEGANVPEPIVHGTRRSTRAWRPTQRYLEGKEQEAVSLPAAARIAEYDEECKTFIDDVHPFSVLASTDGDTMYWDQAIK
jgi:hypothetical protein